MQSDKSCTKRIACVIKVVTRTYPLSRCYISFARNFSRDKKYSVKMAAKNISKRPHVFFPKRSKGELLMHYKLSFQQNELALADINKVCVFIHVKESLNHNDLWIQTINANTRSSLVIIHENSENILTRWIVWLLDITNSYKTRWLIKLPSKVIWQRNKHCVRSVRARGCCRWRSMNTTVTSKTASLFVLEKIAEVLMHRITWKKMFRIQWKCFKALKNYNSAFL